MKKSLILSLLICFANTSGQIRREDFLARCFPEVLLFKGVKSNDIEAVKLSIGTIDVNSYQDGLTAVHHAAKLNFFQLLDCLVKKGANINAPGRVVKEEGFTPLHYAARNGNVEAVRKLLSLGADHSVVIGKEMITPYFLANGATDNRANCQEICALLKQQGACNLHEAVRADDAQGVQERLKVETIQEWEERNIFLVYLAVANDNDKIIELLLENGANPNARNDQGMTPLLQACLDGRVQAVKILLRLGADWAAREKKTGWGALDVAILMGHLEVVKLLIEEGMPLHDKMASGNTPLGFARFWAYNMGRPGHYKIISYLVEMGAKR